MPSRTPRNGLETANQKEASPPESFAVLLVFTLFSQAFEGRDFRKSEIFRPGTAAQRRGTVRFELVIQTSSIRISCADRQR
jgi:hypothetical protein